MVEMHNIYPLRTPLNIEKIGISLYGTNNFMSIQKITQF